MLREVLKWINLADDALKDLVEDEVDTGTSKTFSCNILDESTLQLLAVLFEEPTDQVKDYRSHVVLIHGMVLRIVIQ